jgi:hypothetical protein
VIRLPVSVTLAVMLVVSALVGATDQRAHGQDAGSKNASTGFPTSAQAADQVAKACEDAVTKGERPDEIVLAAQRCVRDLKYTAAIKQRLNSAVEQAADAVVTAAAAKRGQGGNPRQIADAAKSAAANFKDQQAKKAVAGKEKATADSVNRSAVVAEAADNAAHAASAAADRGENQDEVLNAAVTASTNIKKKNEIQEELNRAAIQAAEVVYTVAAERAALAGARSQQIADAARSAADKLKDAGLDQPAAKGALNKATTKPGDPKDVGKASQAAEATANAAIEAFESGEGVDGVVKAADRVVSAYEVVQNPVGSKVSRTVAEGANAARNKGTSNPQSVAEAAKTWADAIKRAEGRLVDAKASDSTSLSSFRLDLVKDLPPASPKLAFDSVLQLSTTPALSAAGEYEYGLYDAPRTEPKGDAQQRGLSHSDAPSASAKVTTLPAPSGTKSLPDSGAGGETEQAELLGIATEISALRAQVAQLKSIAGALATSRAGHGPPRRMGFFAVRYESSGQEQRSEEYARRAGWAGARAVRSQLVSLTSPGLGYSVSLRKDQSLVVGACSFDDRGHDPRYNWIAFERDNQSLRQWIAYTIVPGDARDVLLRRGLTSKTEIPKPAKNQLIVADVNGVLHFRLISPTAASAHSAQAQKESDTTEKDSIAPAAVPGKGTPAENVVEKDETTLTQKAPQISYLKKVLKNLWPKHKLTKTEKRRILALVIPILGDDDDDDDNDNDGSDLFERDLVKYAPVDRFGDQRVGISLGPEVHRLGFDPRGTLLQEYEYWKEPSTEPDLDGPDSPQWPTVRAVISGDIITFSIEVRNGDASGDDSHFPAPPASFHLAGKYRHEAYLPPSSDDRLQLGAVVLCNAGKPDDILIDRAATFGSDVLRRRAESLWESSGIRTERLGFDRHLVLFVRNGRSGETSWLSISGDGASTSPVSTKILGRRFAAASGVAVLPPCVPAPWLAPALSNGVPAESYMMYLGGSQGYRLIEIMLTRKPVMMSPDNPAGPSLFDVGYLFLSPR